MIEYKTIYDIPLYSKKVLLSVDYNVPIETGLKTPYRLIESLSTIKYLLNQKASIIIISHRGRPRGIYQSQFSLKCIAKMLSKSLNHPVDFMDSCISESTKNGITKMKPGQIVLLENLRFHIEEIENDIYFAKKLASYADYHINDSFGTIHRNQASTVSVPKFILTVPGLLMDKEIQAFNFFVKQPIQKKVFMIGGSKVSSKLEILNLLLNKAKSLIIVGAMSYTILKALNYQIGDSLIEESQLNHIKEFLEEAKFKKVDIYLPVDHVAQCNNDIKIFNTYIANSYKGMDVGPRTIEMIKDLIKKNNYIFWNGPLGVVENPNFSNGTNSIAKFLSESNNFRIVGGGNSVSAIQNLNLENKFNHVSTGGGSAIYFIALESKLKSIQAFEKLKVGINYLL